MSLESKIVALAQAIGADIKTLTNAQGSLSSLTTTTKASLVAALNELKIVVDGLVASSSGVSINDTAGDGATTVTWSANKIFDTIETAKAAVKDELLGGAGTALDTLAELAAALGNDPSFAATLAAQIANRVRFDEAQTLTETQKTTARSNIGAVSTAAVGDTERDLVATYTAAKA